MASANADEIQLDEEDDDDDDDDGNEGEDGGKAGGRSKGPEVEEKQVPDAVFGELGARARFAQQQQDE